MKTIRVALIQFDSHPEAVEENLSKMESLAQQAIQKGARWIMFHEGCVCDYTPRLSEFAESVPNGPSTQSMINLAQKHDRFISFGLSESDNENYFISQVFVGPAGFIYRYRKTWLWREPDDKGYRNEWVRYDPGTGPEPFDLDGVKATCFICADGVAPRCIERAKGLRPEIVFFPTNRESLGDFEIYGKLAATIGAPMLVTNRTGLSWFKHCKGGSVVYSARGEVLAKSNRNSEEEVLIHDLVIQ